MSGLARAYHKIHAFFYRLFERITNRGALAVAVAVNERSLELIRQLRFLLDQAPMLNAPESIERAAHAVTKFAYIHPATWARFTTGGQHPPEFTICRIFPAPTQWVVTSLMPEGRVIFTPNAMPGRVVKS